MKRILPLILALVAGMAQAATAVITGPVLILPVRFRGGVRKRYSGALSLSIPSYNESGRDKILRWRDCRRGWRPESTTEWATGETGKPSQVTTEQAEDILSPDCTVHSGQQGCGEPGPAALWETPGSGAVRSR
ncbi:hypothetical protein [Escherichia coli]|uniref:hypothetical protein n=1 Tax=Escherichia coli TaxID=562 RepID=UPI003DA280B0